MNCKHGYNEKYHKKADWMMDKLFSECIENPAASIESTLCCIHEYLKRFPKDQQSNANFLALNVLFCHYGDKVKQQLKGSDMDSFLLECYNDILRNNLNTSNLKSTQDRLNSKEQSLCHRGPCERTAFNYRLMGSWCLQNAWTTKNDVRSFYKRKALECFKKCKEHLQELSEQYPSCTYLTVLHIKASTNIIFLEEKLCWFLFSRVSMIHRFDQHRPEMNNIEIAERLIRVAEKEASRVKEGTSGDYQIKHKLLLACFFFHCRIAQCREQKQDQKRALTNAEEILRLLRKKYPHDINCGDWDDLSELLEHLKRQLSHVITEDHQHNVVFSPDCFGNSSDSHYLDKGWSGLSGLSSSSEGESLSEGCLM